jgi:hypothetical protein
VSSFTIAYKVSQIGAVAFLEAKTFNKAQSANILGQI